ncbi:MAG: hypothetical protein RL033_6372 [Pseudomonadota bacterium]|jgi:uncharacterized MAPEG superfamily protein
MTDLHYLALSALLAWFQLIAASLLRSRSWTPAGAQIAFGNRDVVPEPSPLASRADRAARNLLEGLLLFTALVAAVRLGGKPVPAGAAALFFWARVVYFAVYLAGVPYLRTVVWIASIVALGRIAAAAF